MGRAKLKELKETTLNTFFEICSRQGITKTHFIFNAQSGTIKFFNGSEIILKDLFLYPSDPNFDSLGSLEISGAFIDECNQVVRKAWNITKSRIRYKLDEYGIVPKILGTCNPSKTWVYQDFYKPDRNKTLSQKKIFIQSLLGDNPHVSKHYRENLLTLDKVSIQRLLHGDWEYDDAENALCSYEAISSMFTNSHVNSYTGGRYITADIATRGSDSFVIGVWQGFTLFHYERIEKCTAKDIEKKIRQLARHYHIPQHRICFDSDGVGDFLTGYLESAEAFVNNARMKRVATEGSDERAIKEEYKNLKSQCYFRLANAIRDGKIWIQCDLGEDKERLIEELEAQLRNDSHGTDKVLAVPPKDKIKEMIGRSPDIADMIMMRFYYTLNDHLADPRDIAYYHGRIAA